MCQEVGKQSTQCFPVSLCWLLLHTLVQMCFQSSLGCQVQRIDNIVPEQYCTSLPLDRPTAALVVEVMVLLSGCKLLPVAVTLMEATRRVGKRCEDRRKCP